MRSANSYCRNHYDDYGSAPAEGVGGGAGTEAEVYNKGPVYLYGLVYTHRTEPRRSMNKQYRNLYTVRVVCIPPLVTNPLFRARHMSTGCLPVSHAAKRACAKGRKGGELE